MKISLFTIVRFSGRFIPQFISFFSKSLQNTLYFQTVTSRFSIIIPSEYNRLNETINILSGSDLLFLKTNTPWLILQNENSFYPFYDVKL